MNTRDYLNKIIPLTEAPDSLMKKKEELERHVDEVAQGFITNWKHSYRDSFPATPLAQIQGPGGWISM